LKRFFPVRIAPHYKIGSCGFAAENVAFSTVAVLYSWPSIAAGRVKNQQHCACLPTSQDSSFYVSIFLVSGKREVEEMWKDPNLCTIIFSVFLF